MILRRYTIAMTAWCIVGLAGVCHAQSDPLKQPSSKKVDLVDQGGELSFLGDRRPCNFDPEQLFCGVGYRGGGLIESSPAGHYLYVLRGLKKEKEPDHLRVLPWSWWPEACDAAIGVIDLKTCQLIRIIRIQPGRGGDVLSRDTDVAFETSREFLTVRYPDYTTDVYRAPDFKQRMTLPFQATLLGELPGGRLVAFGVFRDSRQGYYVVLADEGTKFREVVRRNSEEWRGRLLLDLHAPGGWRALYADDEVFAVLYPGGNAETGGKGPGVAAYRFAGGSPAEQQLPAEARDIRVKRDGEGRLVSSWSVGDKSVTGRLTFPQRASWEYCKACRHAPREATHWIDAQGNLLRLSDRHVCSYDSYTLRSDGGRYDFLPCQSETYLWASPRGHYLVLPGSLNPKQDPESTGEAGGPGCFRNGYDPVLAVIDLDRCRIVRFIRISSKDIQWGAEVRFSPDDSLLMVDWTGEVYAAPDFRKVAVKGKPLPLPLYRETIDMTTTGRNGETYLGWSVSGREGMLLLRRSGTKAEETVIPRRLLKVDDNGSRYYGSRLLYADDSVAAYLACDDGTPKHLGARPPAVVTVSYRAEEPQAAVSHLPWGVRDVSVKRDKDGRLVCRYRAGGKQVVKRLSPGASTPGAKPQQADN